MLYDADAAALESIVGSAIADDVTISKLHRACQNTFTKYFYGKFT